MIKNYSAIRDSDGVCVNIFIWDADAQPDYSYGAGHTVAELKSAYSTGSGAVSVTNGNNTVTATGATLLDDGVEVGRRVKFSGSDTVFVITAITSNTEFTIDSDYDSSTTESAEYSVFPISIGDVIS